MGNCPPRRPAARLAPAPMRAACRGALLRILLHGCCEHAEAKTPAREPGWLCCQQRVLRRLCDAGSGRDRRGRGRAARTCPAPAPCWARRQPGGDRNPEDKVLVVVEPALGGVSTAIFVVPDPLRRGVDARTQTPGAHPVVAACARRNPATGWISASIGQSELPAQFGEVRRRCGVGAKPYRPVAVTCHAASLL